MKIFIILFSIFVTVNAQGIAYFDDIKDLPNHPEILLIEIRNVTEVASTGLIPTSIHIPVASLEWAHHLSDSEFYSIYSRKKPQLVDQIIFTCLLGIRALSAARNAISAGYTNAQGVALFEEIKDLPNRPEILLIDVRENFEIASTGLIPTSILIPAASLEWANNLPESEFYSIFSRKKPHLADQIIFTCRSGSRALTAARRAINAGYTNVRVYEGSWLEWCVKMNQPCS